MARTDGTVYINTEVDANGFDSGINSMQSSIGKFGKALKKLGNTITTVFAAKKLVNFAKEAIELGSDLQEVQNVVDVTFTTMSEKVDEFAQKAAKTAGLSETMAKKYVGTFGSMADAFGFTEEQSYQMSTALTQLSGDVASFYNITQDEAYTKLKSVFTGETESLKDLGVVMTQTALDSYAMANGFGMTTSQMSEQQKVALRYQFVMDQLSAASGDFQRTSTGWANQMRILSLNIESLKANIGQGLINLFTPLIQVLNAVIERLTVVGTMFKEFTERIMGKSATEGTSKVSESLSDLSEGYELSAEGIEDYAEATEEAADANKKSLSSFDDLNMLTSGISDNLADSGFGNISITSPTTGIDNTQASETESIFSRISKKISEIANKFPIIQSIITGIKNGIALVKEIATDLYNLFIAPFADNKDGFLMVAQDIIAFMADIVTTIVEGINEAINYFAEVYKKSIQPVVQDITEGISHIISLVLQWWEDYMKPVLDKWGESFSQMWDEHISPLMEKLATFFGYVIEKIGEVWNEVLQPFIEWIAREVLPAITPAIEGIGEAFITAFGVVGDVVGYFIDALTGLVDFVAGAFMGDWESAWNGLTDVFKGIINTLVGVFEGFVNFVIDAINSIIDGANSLSGTIGFDVNIPSIPRLSIPKLATGAVIPPNAPFLAMLGDQRNGTNIEAPLDTIKQGLAEVLAEMGINVTFEVEGDEAGIFKVTQRQAKMFTKQTGKPAYPTGG